MRLGQRQLEAADRYRERRGREDAAPRLRDEVDGLQRVEKRMDGTEAGFSRVARAVSDTKSPNNKTCRICGKPSGIHGLCPECYEKSIAKKPEDTAVLKSEHEEKKDDLPEDDLPEDDSLKPKE